MHAFNIFNVRDYTKVEKKIMEEAILVHMSNSIYERDST